MYLLLVISDTYYLTLPGTMAIAWPIHPSNFTLPANPTYVHSAALKFNYERGLPENYEYVDIQQSLRNQNTQAINTKYLIASQNSTTNNITKSVLEISNHLKNRKRSTSYN